MYNILPIFIIMALKCPMYLHYLPNLFLNCLPQFIIRPTLSPLGKVNRINKYTKMLQKETDTKKSYNIKFN